MKKLLSTSLIMFASLGILFAGDCNSKDYAKNNKSTPEIVLRSNNLQLLQYSDKNVILDLPYKILMELL